MIVGFRGHFSEKRYAHSNQISYKHRGSSRAYEEAGGSSRDHDFNNGIDGSDWNDFRNFGRHEPDNHGYLCVYPDCNVVHGTCAEHKLDDDKYEYGHSSAKYIGRNDYRVSDESSGQACSCERTELVRSVFQHFDGFSSNTPPARSNR